MSSHLKGPNEGNWSVFAEKVVAERDEALAVIRDLQGEKAARHTLWVEVQILERRVKELEAELKSAYQTLEEFDIYGTGGDVAACAREVKQRLLEAETALKRERIPAREGKTVIPEKRFMVMRAHDKYVGESFNTREEAEKHAKQECNGDPGGDHWVFELIGYTTRPRHPEAVLTRLP
jgi:ElaB/YqjD/DUF883 family membrane-anchored ribosome-binding protein